ncbi:MAG: cupin domain-containing protein [Myxococcota bacterium]|nr:cupin domain-containing protein [Myxococcota bacterium]
MANRRTVENDASGETFIFSDEWNDPNGFVRQLKYKLKPGGKVPRHFHLGRSQSFKVLAGELSVEVDRVKSVLKAGDESQTGVDSIHSQWNAGTETVHVIEGFDPPIDIEPFFTAFPIVFGSKNPLKQFVFLHDHRHVSTQKRLFVTSTISAFAVVGTLFGLSGWYKKTDR